jgi:hypothetical protein
MWGQGSPSTLDREGAEGLLVVGGDDRSGCEVGKYRPSGFILGAAITQPPRVLPLTRGYDILTCK